MAYTIACWNIEKNGISSNEGKQANVSEFINICANRSIDVIFICEVHSARIGDYVEFLTPVYGGAYTIHSFEGGHSNAYVVMIRKGTNLVLSYDMLKGLNRRIVMVHDERKFMLCLAHFKSGQTGLTKDQLEQAAAFLEDAQPGCWAITGDMNWHHGNFANLIRPGGAHAATCWADMTQIRGNILDWCMAGGAVAVTPADLSGLAPTMKNMSGPDHRPVIFTCEVSSNW